MSAATPTTLRAPFPYFGTKSYVTTDVWMRLGDVPNYVEPFAGTLSILLGRPHSPAVETVNDADGMLVNFWRAVQADSAAVAQAASLMTAELNLRAWHNRIRAHRAGLCELLGSDPDAYDAELAGAWAWGACNSIAEAWHRHTRQSPALRTVPTGLSAWEDMPAGLAALSSRLSTCRILCGDWTRAVTPERTRKTPCAIVLDPPYGEGDMEYAAGGNATSIAADAHGWALRNGNNPELRIAYCGYEGAVDFPDSWECFAWKSRGGFAVQGDGEGRENAARERIWFSPHCLKPAVVQPSLFADLAPSSSPSGGGAPGEGER